MTIIAVILMIQGAGSAAGQPLPLAKYDDMASCNEAVVYAEKNKTGGMWAHLGCVPIVGPDAYNRLLVH